MDLQLFSSMVLEAHSTTGHHSSKKQACIRHMLSIFMTLRATVSPTSPLSELTIDSLAEDLKSIFDHARITSGAVLFAHSLGCLIVVHFVLQYPDLVSKLILVGPPPSLLPAVGGKALHTRAALARRKGMRAVVDVVVSAGTSGKTRKSNAVAVTVVRLSLLGQNPKGYAKACSALAKATNSLDFSRIEAETFLVTGSEDTVSPRQVCEEYEQQLQNGKGLMVLQDVGHWHVFEDTSGVAKVVSSML